jgi:hypothetical protein
VLAAGHGAEVRVLLAVPQDEETPPWLPEVSLVQLGVVPLTLGVGGAWYAEIDDQEHALADGTEVGLGGRLVDGAGNETSVSDALAAFGTPSEVKFDFQAPQLAITPFVERVDQLDSAAVAQNAIWSHAHYAQASEVYPSSWNEGLQELHANPKIP